MESTSIQEKKYIKAKDINEAISAAKDHLSESSYLAGGTDVMVNRFQGNETSPCLIDITGIEELKGIEVIGSNLSIGALEILDELSDNEAIRNNFPSLLEAAHSVASPLIRKTATLGGNILCENRCLYYNQSEWWRESVGYCLKCEGDICIATGGKKACFSELVSDTAPALIAMNAQLNFEDVDGSYQVNLEDIYTGDGVKPRNVSSTAILKSILLPMNKGFKVVFNKLRQRESLDFTSLTTAVSLDNSGSLKIAMSGVDPKAVVIEAKSSDNKEDLIKKAIKGARAIDNDMLGRKYRRKMIDVYLRRSFEELKL